MRVSAVLSSGIYWSYDNLIVYDEKGDKIPTDYILLTPEIFMDRLVDKFYYTMQTYTLVLWLKDF